MGRVIILLLLMVSLSSEAITIWFVRPDLSTGHFTCPDTAMVCYRFSQLLQKYREAHSSINILYFQPGVYNLNDNIMFANLSTLHFQGYGMPVISCYTNKHYSLTFQNISTIIINSISFEYCGSISRSSLKYSRYQPAALHFINCYDTSLHNIVITPSANSSGIVLVDCQGVFILTNYTIVMKHCNNKKHTLQYGILMNFTGNINSPANYQLTLIQLKLNNIDCYSYMIGIGHLQRSGNVVILIEQLNISHVINPRVLYYYSNACMSYSSNQLHIDNSTFNSNTELKSTMFDIKFEDCWLKESYTSQQGNIRFSYCQIMDNLWSIAEPFIVIVSKFSVFAKSRLFISKCNFNNNTNMLILKVKSKNDLAWVYSNFISITDTSITGNTITADYNERGLTMISTQNTLLSIAKLTVTNNRYNKSHSIFQLKNDSVMQMRSLNILAYNSARYLVQLKPDSYICMMDNSDYRINNNNVRSMFSREVQGNKIHNCIFQFVSSKGSLDTELISVTSHLYNITIKNNIERRSMFPKREMFNTSGCELIPGTAFNDRSYSKLASFFIVKNENEDKHDICSCDKNGNPLCKHDVLVATYPGRTVTTKLSVPNGKETITLFVDELQSNCTLLDSSERYQSQSNNCSEFHYTLSSLENSNCSLYLTEKETSVTDNFWVTLEPCPLGFSFNAKTAACKCDQILRDYSLPITSCNINNKMITRPANSWISGEVKNENHLSDYIFIYKASSSCPFNYCQQQSLELLLNESDMQCQYNRTGVACGHCPVNLSTIFGSSRCQKCSNIYLLIIIPITIAGLVLVLLMFMLNLTIVNGSIGTLILYVNIISINKTLLFPTHLTSTIPLYVLIAMANLDLGIELCFYDGMDDYTKMWLQLAFPLYLIFIAMLLIIASRHFRIVQRVTAQRGLPVLATLFLLSYTKILSTTCTVLFTYTTVVTLSRSGRSALDHSEELVWAVSTNITLFEGKHTALFIVNTLLLLILIPFNIILLFNRSLSRFKMIQKFKPILDPYKAPYKDKFHYWAGYQLVMRMAYLSAAALNKNNNLTVAMLITGFAMCFHGYCHPFKHNLLNLQELMMLLNVLIAYVSTNFEREYHMIVRAVVGVAMIYFTLVLLWHSITQTCSKFLLRNLPHKVTEWKEKLSNSCELDKKSQEDETYVLRTYEEYREPLVAVTD